MYFDGCAILQLFWLFGKLFWEGCSGKLGGIQRTFTEAGKTITPGWRNWQTQRTQNPPIARSWGFDPPSRHHHKQHKMNKLRGYRRL
jgi:hypothetical protein